MGRDHQNNLSRNFFGILITEQTAQSGDVINSRNGFPVSTVFFRYQSSQDDGFPIAHIEGRVGCSGSKPELSNFRTGLENHPVTQSGDFNLQAEGNGVVQMDGWLNGDFDARILKLNRRHSRGGGNCTRGALSRQDIRG